MASTKLQPNDENENKKREEREASIIDRYNKKKTFIQTNGYRVIYRVKLTHKLNSGEKGA
jgi:hypothetical protein